MGINLLLAPASFIRFLKLLLNSVAPCMSSIHVSAKRETSSENLHVLASCEIDVYFFFFHYFCNYGNYGIHVVVAATLLAVVVAPVVELVADAVVVLAVLVLLTTVACTSWPAVLKRMLTSALSGR